MSAAAAKVYHHTDLLCGLDDDWDRGLREVECLRDASNTMIVDEISGEGDYPYVLHRDAEIVLWAAALAHNRKDPSPVFEAALRSITPLECNDAGAVYSFEVVEDFARRVADGTILESTP